MSEIISALYVFNLKIDRRMEDAEEGSEDMSGQTMQDGDMVQVIMQDDGQIVMPEGQFIQVNADDGQTQFIQVCSKHTL